MFGSNQAHPCLCGPLRLSSLLAVEVLGDNLGDDIGGWTAGALRMEAKRVKDIALDTAGKGTTTVMADGHENGSSGLGVEVDSEKDLHP